MQDPMEYLDGEYDLAKLLNLRTELERYIQVIDEHVITSKTDLSGVITYVSHAFEEISGYKKDELIGENHRLIRHQDMSKELFEDLWKTIKSGKTWSGEIKNLRKDGSFYWVNAKITPEYDSEGKHIGYTSVRQDISDKKKIEELSLTDELTKLNNRRSFNQVLDVEISRACRDEKVFSFVILDIDDFKNYNDNYGHNKGDEVLQSVASFLDNSLKRATDMVFRLGGEEFALIYSTKEVSQAIELAKKLCKGIEKLGLEHNFSNTSKNVTASFGVAICDFTKNPHMSADKDKLYEISDKELYSAKESGKNQISYIEVV
jgi:diguanylate cyclase (GGDEF)-like protein/PAS domain S-box-containing protein